MAATRLYFTASVDEQWSALAGPWLREKAATAWKGPKPAVVLTPSRAEGFYLKSRLVAEGVPCLGLRFWTPSDARQFLLAEIAPELGAATQAEQRLVARACAENLAARQGAENATLASAVREPGAFLRAYDLLLGAGWNPAREGADYGRDLAREMQRVLEKSGVATQAGVHRRLRVKVAAGGERLIGDLLMVGFNAAHWPLWDLLQTVVFSAESATIGLANPREFGAESDRLWHGSWEEITRGAAMAPPAGVDAEERAAPFSTLVDSYEKGAPEATLSTDLAFRVTPDLATQTQAIALQAVDYLKRDSCTRLGIVFAESNALALGVADALRRLGIPLDDGIGFTKPGPFERRSWQSWLALQEEPGAPRLIAWLRACEAEGVACGIDQVRETISAREIASVVERALAESLIDDLPFLARQMESGRPGNRAGAVADFLRGRVVLPEGATFAAYLALTRQAAALAGWEEHLARLRIDPPAWLLEQEAVISRRTFLGWLKEATASQGWTSGREGNHFYGRVHLLIYAQMTGQSWSHLILTGLNEGVWPRVFEAGAFGSRHQLEELNRQARALNRRGETQGGQGEGHETVRAGHGHILLPLERQDLALRDLCAALEATSHSACLTAVTTEAGRSLLPGDFFNHAYQVKNGHALDEETFRALANATETWCRAHAPLLVDDAMLNRRSVRVDAMPLFAQANLAQTRIAYHARRDETRPFGAYEFAYARPPASPIQLSCKRWEDAWNHPATVWLEEIVGASPWPQGVMSWQQTVGTWTHRWLAAALREWREMNAAPAELPVLVWAAADREAKAVRRRAQEAEVELYPWWEQVWAQARSIALGLGEALAPILPERPFLCEFKLPPGLAVALPGCELADFSLTGRVDLLLLDPGAASPEVERPDLDRRTCWIVDFKTGSAQSLNAKKIADGKGLQPVLYALAARALGAASTAISLHTVDAPLAPQMELDDVVEFTPLFRSLDLLHRAGIFGMRPDADSAYGFSPSYPMATRFVPGAILKAKWALVHGGMDAEGEGE
jgi:hypothetical protein